MRPSIISFLFIYTVLTTCTNLNTEQNDLLIGTWIGVKEEKMDENIVENEEEVILFEESSAELIANFTLFKGGTAKDNITGQSFKYKINDNVITFGNRKYRVTKLSSYEMILCDLPENSYSDIYCTTYQKK